MEKTNKKLTFEIDINKIKSREQFLKLLDKVLEYDFVGNYNDHKIIRILYKKEKLDEKVTMTQDKQMENKNE